jgi:hypothetical protein
MVQIGRGTSTAEFLIQYANGTFNRCRRIPPLPVSFSGYALLAPESSSLMEESLYCGFSPTDESSPWGKRFFLRFSTASDPVRVDESYSGCVYPKGLESRGFGTFLAAGSVSESYFMCGIVPVLINMKTCQEVDLSDKLGLSSRDIGMHSAAYYTQSIRRIDDHLHWVYSLNGRLHWARLNLITMLLVDDRPWEGPELNWASTCFDDSGRLIALNEERKALVVHPIIRSTR